MIRRLEDLHIPEGCHYLKNHEMLQLADRLILELKPQSNDNTHDCSNKTHKDDPLRNFFPAKSF